MRDTPRNPMFAAAVECAHNDLPVYPARPRGKKPLFRGWQQGATVKVEHLAKVWGKHPEANIGILCRGVSVLDADSAYGEDAIAELGLPPTWTVRTRRGSHFYFAGNAPTIPGLLPDVELRGKGSGVLGPGSIHPSGYEYGWEIGPWEVELAPLPGELRQLIDEKRRSVPDGRATVRRVLRRGERSVGLLRIAGSLRGQHGVDDDALEATMNTINVNACKPPLPPERIEKLVRDAQKWPGAYPWLADPAAYCTTDTRLGRNARIILRLLCDHADARGGCFPGLRRLRQQASISDAAVGRAIDELQAAGRIEVRRGGPRRPNRYRLLPYRAPKGAQEANASEAETAKKQLTATEGRTSVPPVRNITPLAKAAA